MAAPAGLRAPHPGPLAGPRARGTDATTAGGGGGGGLLLATRGGDERRAWPELPVWVRRPTRRPDVRSEPPSRISISGPWAAARAPLPHASPSTSRPSLVLSAFPDLSRGPLSFGRTLHPGLLALRSLSVRVVYKSLCPALLRSSSSLQRSLHFLLSPPVLCSIFSGAVLEEAGLLIGQYLSTSRLTQSLSSARRG